MGWGGGGLYVQHFTLNVGCAFLRPTPRAVLLLDHPTSPDLTRLRPTSPDFARPRPTHARAVLLQDWAAAAALPRAFPDSSRRLADRCCCWSEWRISSPKVRILII